MTVTRAELQGGLRALGLEADDRVIVHSSLSSLGWVEGGAETVVDALLEVVGSEGTVMMPTFTTGDAEPFNRAETPSVTGRITEELRTREGAVRSAHPTHSVSAVGANAESLTRGHEPANSLGPDSPMHRLIEAGGSILLLGVDHTSNSSVHIAERLDDLPYRDQTRTATVVDGDGEARTVITNAVHCSYGFDAVEVVARRAGLLTEGAIGEASVQLMDGQALLDELVDVLEAVPNLLLCADPGCDRCAYARERLAEEGLIELRDD